MGDGFESLFTWISEVRFCMMAQMSLVSFGVKEVVSPLGVEDLVVSSMAVVMCFLVLVWECFFWLWLSGIVNVRSRSFSEVSLFHMTAYG